MAQPLDALKVWLRRYVVEGVSSSGEQHPAKADGLSFGVALQSALTGVVEGAMLGSAIVYSTRALLYADLAHVANTLGIVTSDPTPAQNGLYIKSGASGTGAWVYQPGVILPSTVLDDIATLQTNLDAAIASLTADITAGDATVQGNLDAAISSLTSARVAGDALVQSNLDAAVATLNTSITTGDATVQGNLDTQVTALTAARAAGDATVQANLDAAVTTINAALAAGDTGLQTDVDALQAQLDAEEARAQSAEARYTASLGSRPGDMPEAFTSSLAILAPENLPDLTLPIVTGPLGSAVRVTGPATVAMRAPVAIEPDRPVDARFAFARATDSLDPSNDAVRCGILWLDGNKASLGTQALIDVTNLLVSDGRRAILTTIGRAAGDGIDTVAPADACYARAYVQLFGTTPSTDVEVCGLEPIVDAALFANDVPSGVIDEIQDALGWNIETANFGAAAGQKYYFDTRVAGFTATMPAAPALYDAVTLVDLYATAAGHPLSINSNGKNVTVVQNGVRHVVAAADRLQVDTDRARLEMMYIGGTDGWLTFIPLGPAGPVGPPGGHGDSAVFQLPTRDVVFTANAYTTVSADRRCVLSCNTGGVDQTLTLGSPTEAGDGVLIAPRKSDAAAGKVIVTDGTTILANLRTQGDVVYVRVRNNVWEVNWRMLSPLRTVLDGPAVGTFVPDPLTTQMELIMIGAGGPGASGSTGAAAVATLGGGGGAPGNIVRVLINRAALTPLTYNIAGRFNGGAAIAGASTAGANGATPTNTTFGQFTVRPGNVGAGVGTGGNGLGGGRNTEGVILSGITSLSTAAAPAPVESAVGPGGAGGGISTGNVAQSGTAGGIGSAWAGTRPTAGVAGTTGGAIDGTDGADATDAITQRGGSGGAGGAANASGAGNSGNGGKGGTPGGGGGGGGAARNGGTSGAGGQGGASRVIVREFF
jgi:hypothetical protein